MAWLVAGLVVWLWVEVRRRTGSGELVKTANWLLGFVCLQILLGISVVLFNVPPALASLHQATAIGIFLALLVFLHQLGRREWDRWGAFSSDDERGRSTRLQYPQWQPAGDRQSIDQA
jgi:heme A synthase